MKLGKLKLNELSKSSLTDREKNFIRGGYGNDPYDCDDCDDYYDPFYDCGTDHCGQWCFTCRDSDHHRALFECAAIVIGAKNGLDCWCC